MRTFIIYSSCIIRVIKSRRIRWAGHVAHMRHERCIQNLSENLDEGNQVGDLGIDERINIKMDLKVLGYEDLNWSHLAKYSI
jgi:hypothetical protein